jgi:hypothetical protein
MLIEIKDKINIDKDNILRRYYILMDYANRNKR